MSDDVLPQVLHGLFSLVGWQWGWWHPAAHLAFELLGYSVAWGVYRQQAQPDILTPTDRRRLRGWVLVGALLGAKLVPVLEQVGSPYLWATLISGKSLAGGLLGGIVGTELGKRRLGLPLGVSTGDVLVWPLLWGSVVGRLGCSASAVVDGMLGQTYPSGTGGLLAGLRPLLAVDTRLPELTRQSLDGRVLDLLTLDGGWHWNLGTLEALGLLTLGLGLAGCQKLSRQAWPAGGLFYRFCLGYFLLRLGLESVKHGADGLSVVQGISLLGLAWSGAQLLRCRQTTSSSRRAALIQASAPADAISPPERFSP